MQRTDDINVPEIQDIMNDASIQSVSVASGSRKGKKDDIIPTYITPDSQSHPRTPVEDTVFGAASLSKPVFVYLVLKLIGTNGFKLDTNLDKDILPFKAFCAQNKIEWLDTEENRKCAAALTPAMILAHMTGLPIGYREGSGPLKFEFEPGKGYGYSGIHLMYLQACIKEKFKLSLEALAIEYVFGPAGMMNSTFNTPEANAANSLRTTAADYARFCLYWMHDPDPRVQDAFKEKVSLLDDPWARRVQVSENVLRHLAWGYGWGLEKDDSGDIVKAFHTGDMGPWRAGVQLDLKARTVKVFFSKSDYENGHVLQEEIFGKSYALDYFFDKYKFARTPDELRSDWRENRSYGERKPSVVNSEHKAGSTGNVDAHERVQATHRTPNPLATKPKP